ncbi:PA14 domain protein (fragment) [Verrucomicrobia bacterium]
MMPVESTGPRLCRRFVPLGTHSRRRLNQCWGLALSLWAAGVGLEALGSPAPTNLTPIAVTGWNRDVVVESSAVGPPFTNYASEMNAGEGTAFYQTGLPTYAWGLPPSGAFVSTIGDDTIFQFQPYTSNNALVLSSDTGLTNGTLTLAAPAIYAKIAVVAHSGNGSSQTGTLTLNFTDGSVLVTNYLAPDWFNGSSNVAWFGPGRIDLVSGSDTGGLENPRFYQTTVNIAAAMGATNKPLASLTFGKAVATSTAIYAVSGQLAASAVPIPVTGFNRDVIIESTASGPPYTSYTAELSPGEGTAFYQHGLPGTTYGLPVSGSFESSLDGTLFQLQPATSGNALVLSSETGVSQGTLTLASPALYNTISILANSAGGGGTPAVTLSFADGSTFVTNYNAPDWFSNAGFALQGFDLINLTTGATQGGPTDPRFYQTTFDLVAVFGATNKPLTSLTFSQAAGAGATAIYALSGVRGAQTNGPFAVPAVADAAASAIQARAATLGGMVTSTGGDAPEVMIYYGTADGGTNAANWPQRIGVGVQTGPFAQTVTGLLPGTTYFFTTAAINEAGTGWATRSGTFATTTATLAAITNLPASNLGSSSALLSGQMISIGGDAPSVTLYYGPANGGNNPASWAYSIALGTQVGRFAELVSELSSNTTYYFTAEAVNAAGPVWAAPVQSFTTPASNPAPSSLVAVLTQRNDSTRQGLNTNETILTPANVNTNSFGKLFSYSLDGYEVAQPLVLPNVAIPGKGVHNVVFAATEHDSVYAFDADGNGGPNAEPLWHISFINPNAGIYTINATADLASIAGGFVGPELGISGTPVIDPVTGTLYVIAITKEVVNNVTNFFNRLHALDVTTGAEKFGGPVAIQGSVPGVGDGNDGMGHVPFVALKHHNRPGLLLNNGTVYIAFTGHFDYPPYHGWVFAYDAYTLAQTGIFNANPNGSDGGFWESGCGPAADPAGNIYLESGNGNWDSTNGNYGNSVLKLATTNGLTLADWFTPYNQLYLNLQDIDVGSAGQIIVPDSAGSAAHPHLLIAGSKAGTIYLLDRDNMGHFNPSGDSQIVQSVVGAVNGMWCTPAWFNGQFYYIASGDHLKAFVLSNGLINTTPVGQGTNNIGSSSPSISANGTSDGIVWAVQPSSPIVLHAYDAANVAHELYNSGQNSARDNAGPSVKFTVPTVANGKVYVGSANSLSVFGNSAFLALPAISPSGGTFTNSVTVTLSNAVPGATIYYTLDGTTPTTNSALYVGPFAITQSAGLQAVATMPGSPNSPVAEATFYKSSSLGNGTGLLGQYYANTFPTAPFVGSPLVRTDATINFNWNTVSPDPSIPLINYTVRWTGLVQPVFSELYTFYTTTDDGVRLWINGQELVNQWVPQSPTTWSGSIDLQGGQLYALEMDYFQAQGGAVAQLAWSSPSTTQAIIPQTQLYPTTVVPPVFLPAANYFTNGAFELQISSVAGKGYVFQGTTDLVHWVSLSTNVAPSNLLMFLDSGATNLPLRFYRAIEQP